MEGIKRPEKNKTILSIILEYIYTEKQLQKQRGEMISIIEH
jgi:hypothetical protein